MVDSLVLGDTLLVSGVQCAALGARRNEVNAAADCLVTQIVLGDIRNFEGPHTIDKGIDAFQALKEVSYLRAVRLDLELIRREDEVLRHEVSCKEDCRY